MRSPDWREFTHAGLTAVMAVLAVTIVAWPAEAKKRGGHGAAASGVAAGVAGARIINRANAEEPQTAQPTAADAGQNAAEAIEGAAAKAATEKADDKSEAAPGAAAAASDLPKAKMGNPPTSVRQTSYGQSGKTARPGSLAGETTLPVPKWMTVTCEAGCVGAPGQAVLDQPIDPGVHVARQSVEVMKLESATSTIVCMGGCYGVPQQIAGLPGGVVAGDLIVRTADGEGKTLTGKQSGAWMVRINRDRGEETAAEPAAAPMAEPAPGTASEAQ